MKIEEQVCTREQSKRLLDLGIEGDVIDGRDIYLHLQISDDSWCVAYKQEKVQYLWAYEKHQMLRAFNVAELGEMLPIHCDSRKHDKVKKWVCDEGITGDCFMRYGNTEAQARAAMLIYLLEQNLVTPAEIMKRVK
jgi:hypothetical protein